MAVTPLIKPITTQKGMFYAFQSAIEDLTLNFNNNSNKFKFSKFALLRIPEITVPSSISTDNVLQYLAQGETEILDNISVDPNINLANSFQNYALNFESLLVSQSTYQRDLKLNVSERVFWKWLKELGAIRWRSANSGEVISSLPSGEARWSEDWGDPSLTTYNRVVKYIGEIDIVNSLRSSDNSYSELYIHVPTTVGMTPAVLFNSKPDVNYNPDMIIVNSPSDPLDIGYLNGRHYSDTHPYAGMSLSAFYDLDANAVTTKLSDTLTGVINWSTITTPYPGLSGQGTGFWWGTSTVNNAYHTDQAAYFGTPYGSTPSSSQKNQRIYKTYTDGSGTRTVEYLRSTLDGVVVDFDLANYATAAADSSINTFSQFNNVYGNQDFEFNAILVYYDVYDPTLTGSNASSETNLYGVYFLNKVVQNGGEYIIPMIDKNRPDPISKTNGNAFAFKINVKMDNSIEDVAIEKSINDYSTFSLNLFIDVLNQVSLLQTTFNNKLTELMQLEVDLNKAKDALLNANVISDISNRLAALETTVGTATGAFAEATAIMDLIDSVNGRIDEILSGTTSLQIKYNTDSFIPGYGVSLDKTVPGQISFSSATQMYTDTSIMDISVNSLGIKTLSLGVLGTQLRHKKLSGGGLPISYSMVGDITLLIDDSVNSWKTGQTIKLVFDSQIIPSTYSIYVKTDSQNITSSISTYGVQICQLTAADFATNFGRLGTPIIEITCTDSKTLTFVVDKIIR